MSILKNVLVVLRGSLVAQALGFAVLPVLTRIYSPEAMGHYQIFLSVCSFLLLSAGLRYELAILTANTDECATSIARLCVIINGIMATLVLSVCVVLYALAPGFVEKLGPTVWMLAPAVLVGGALQTATYWLLRAHSFRQTSAAKALQASGYCGAALGFGFLKMTDVGLVLADVTGKALALGYVYKKSLGSSTVIKSRDDRSYTLTSLLTRFRHYPLVSLPGWLLNNAGGTLTPILLFGVFGPATSGQYALVERCIALPIAVVSQAVAQVYMGSFSSALRSRQSDGAELFRKIVITHLKLGLVPTVILVAYGHKLFEMVFGPTWGTAGQFAQVMAPMLLASFLVSPVDMTLQMLDKQKLNFLWHLFRLGLVISAWVAISMRHLTALSAIELHAGVNTVGYLTLLFIIYKSVTARMPLACVPQ